LLLQKFSFGTGFTVIFDFMLKPWEAAQTREFIPGTKMVLHFDIFFFISPPKIFVKNNCACSSNSYLIAGQKETLGTLNSELPGLFPFACLLPRFPV
jgi:hypothetical protein